MEKSITILDKTFVPFLSDEEIQNAIENVAQDIYKKFKDETPLFVGVLNGVVMFFSDMLKHYPGNCEISFIQMKSYQGTSSTGQVKKLMEVPDELVKDRHIIIMEDIVDTGNTLEALYDMMQSKPIASVSIATLLFKPNAYKKDLKIDYIGLSIPDKFVVGYGLDYDGLGRNIPEIYQLKEN
ncbi:hypoxanthine phosphoribosyltransferase [Ornithobacterium rhinotracheale]|uniref:hypoxanthine phosphoribosyltransferase n=1 Tax=Ornithobacterium rhinotracheale TaxID=28251 RepID=UPI001FB97DBD|nr:hypoxanthine phosphoribosyltransferase [Ornithobacterium rhinotracheale]MCK0201728.1 hypoxanthine phosphoribosyltransferase [Ornithobacterium rhinotracheale]UOH76746.1 hypoxanthine phosphoribosyltransferase [Ornithobacterium rhinotracheale]